MAGILIRMKLRIFRNSMTSGRAAWMVIGGIVGVLFAGGTITVAFGALDTPGLTADLLATTYLLWALGWMVGPLWSGAPVLRIEQFTLLPLERRRLALGLLTAAFVSLTAVVTALSFLSLVVYGIRTGPAPALISIPAAAAQLVFVVLLSRVTHALFGAVAGSRVGATITGVLFAAMLVLTQSGWMLIVAVAYSRVLESGFSDFVSTAVRVLPSGWGVSAVDAAGRGDWGQSLCALAGLLALCALLLLVWSRALDNPRHGRAVIRGSTCRTTPARGVYAGTTGAVLRKELWTWLRDPQRVTTAVSAVVWALGTALLPLTFGTKALLPWAGPALPLMALVCAFNLHSQDGTSLWLTLTTGSERADIRGRQLAYLLVFGPLTLAVSIALTAYSGNTWSWAWVAALVPAMLGGTVGLMAYASVTALTPGPDAHKRPGNPLERADTTGPSNVLFWVGLIPAVPAAAVVALGTTLDSASLRWLGAPVGIATGILLTRWLGIVAARQLAVKGPELLFLMRTGRAANPGVGVRAKPELTKREEGTVILCWILGSVALFPQGMLPLFFLLGGEKAKVWFLALYLPRPWSWFCAAIMIAIGLLLYSKAIRLSFGRAGSTRSPAAKKDGETTEPPGSDHKERASV